MGGEGWATKNSGIMPQSTSGDHVARSIISAASEVLSF